MNTLEQVKKLRAKAISDRKRFLASPANKKLFARGTDKPPEYKDKTFLYIRAFDGDLGSRPLPPGAVSWNSPDIEIYDSANAVIMTNEMKQGQRYAIAVNVNNDGDMVCNSCIVELFICAFSVGLDPALATNIGIQTLFVNAHDKSTARFDFSPGPENTGHQCLFARAYSYVNGDMPLSSTQFLVAEDRHVGQQNVSVLVQESTLTFNVILKKEGEDRTFRLVVKRKKAELSRYKTIQLKNHQITTRALKDGNILFRELVRKIPEKSLASIAGRRQVSLKDAVLIKNLSKTIWEHEFKADNNKVVMEIPNLGLNKREAVTYDIEVTSKKSGKTLGGLTIIVVS